MNLKSGVRLGPYEILSRIGEGGMGQVWKATDTRLGRIVAIKTSAEQFSQRFAGEARAVAALNHPHICTLYDVGPDYLVMEYVEGAELKGPLPLEQALQYAMQMAGALEAAQRASITHRDLKPANILITRAGVKVLDFGLAKIGTPEHRMPENGQTVTRALTQEGSIVGTLQYMAPEQLRGEATDSRADIFSFGCVLYEMLTGKRAFDGSNPASLIAAILERPAPTVTRIAPDSLNWVLGRCLAKDREERWQTARDLRAALQRIAEAGVEPASATPSIKAARRPWLLAAAGIAVVTFAGLLSLRQSNAAPPELVRLDLQVPDDMTLLGSIAISPDGRMIAFPATTEGIPRARLWVRPLDSPDARPLAGTEGSNINNVLFWSSDSRTLFFQADGKLRKVDVNGGPVQSLCDLNAAMLGGFVAAGNQVIFGTPAVDGIQACPENGGEARSITSFRQDGKERSHAFPSPLPDGRRFLFTRLAGRETGLYVGSLAAKPEEQTGKRLLPYLGVNFVANPDAGSGQTHGHILFNRQGALMAQGFDAGTTELRGDAIALAQDLAGFSSFSASNDGKLAYLTATKTAQLTWVDRLGKRMGTVGAAAGLWGTMQLSPDGTRLAASRSGDVWVLDLVKGSETRLTASGGSFPVWSPDGMRIAFASIRDGRSDLYLRAADGAKSDELLFTTPEEKRTTDWSRDGRFLLFSSFSAKMGFDVWVLRMDLEGAGHGSAAGGAKAIPYLQTAADEYGARFSPDGRFIAYMSNESGAHDVYVRPFDPANPTASGLGAGKVKISSGGGGSLAWRADGKELLYSSGRKVWSVDVTTVPTFRASAPKLLSEGPPGNKAMTPDGQRFLVDVPLGKTAAKVVLNWRVALQK